MSGQKNTPRVMKRYRLPAYCDCREVIMRELDGKDELEAAIWADKHKSSAAADSPFAELQADHREAMRLSLVQVDGVAVNVGGVPFMAMNDWSLRTMRMISAFFADLNGVDPGELKNAVAAGEIITGGPIEEPEPAEVGGGVPR